MITPAIAANLKNTGDASASATMANITDAALLDVLNALAMGKPLDRFVSGSMTVDWLLRDLAYRTVAWEIWRRSEVAALEAG